MSDKQEKKAVQCIFTEEQRKARDEFEKRARTVSDSHSSTLVIKIDWWLWRNIAMTWIISEVAKHRKVKVIASRPLAFRWNPFIESVHWLWDRRLFQDVIRWNDYVEIEPYTDPRFFNDWENRLKIVWDQFWLKEIHAPKLYLAEREKKAYKLEWNAVLFQPFWSTMDLNWSDKSYRSIPVEIAQYMSEQLTKKWYTVYTCESEKQPELRWVNTLRKITDLRYIVGLCSKYKVIWCDSCLHHASVWFLILKIITDNLKWKHIRRWDCRWMTLTLTIQISERTNSHLNSLTKFLQNFSS